jgi:hypothetical protein
VGDQWADLHPKGGGFEFSFDADSIYSLTTTTGQGKGAAQPPMQHGFPLPYGDDFEQVAEGRAPKYLSDQDGAFEVHACEGRAGRCLEQVITAKPIPWGPLPDPFTLAGDVSWRDYRVTVDVRFIDEGPVTVMGRIDSADVFQDGKAAWPSGYVLNVFSDGRWELNSAKYKVPTRLLAQGTVGLNGHDWHRLELRFKGSGIEALIDGRSVGAVEDGGHVQGMFGVGTGWAREQFDNFKVTPE